jgi:hypothetical protein
MTDVADTRHLERRGDTWHYRRRVPTQYVKAVGKTVLRHSLKTSNLKEARRRRDELNVAYERAFAENDAQSNGRAVEGHRQRQPSINVFIDRIRADLASRERRSAESLRRDPPETHEQRQEMLGDTLARIPDYKITRVDGLLPWNWSNHAA